MNEQEEMFEKVIKVIESLVKEIPNSEKRKGLIRHIAMELFTDLGCIKNAEEFVNCLDDNGYGYG